MKIKELPKETVMKIAAGEVVSGPYSVVKELIENSLDAGADTINIEIFDGGKSLIKVEDNGYGMTEEDMKLSILPHTTSKISSFDDLYNLNTFGFRGEALASISRVSKIKMISKTSQEELGTQLTIFGGNIVEAKKVKSNTGTKIEITDLFFNIPARRKFLKSASVEGRYVTEIVEKFAIANSINLTYIRDNQEIYKFVSNMDLISKCLKVYPELKRDDLLEIEYNASDIKVSGIISNPKIVRSNRTAQTFFVNKRYIKVASLFSVFEKGYGEMLEKSKHPYCIIFIDISPDMIDVNVHPQKLEVKFKDEQKIAALLKDIIRKSLIEKTSFKMEFVKDINDSKVSTSDNENEQNTNFDIQNLYNKSSSEKSVYKDLLKEENTTFSPANNSQTENKPSINYKNENRNIFEPQKNFNFMNFQYPNESEQLFATTSKLETLENLRIVGIVAERYVVVEAKDKMLLVDFHAAHERFIFEELKKEITNKGSLSYNLLISPYLIKIDEVRKAVLIEHKETLEKVGIKIELKNNELFLKGLPSNLKFDNLEALIFDLADDLRLSELEEVKNIFDKNLATIACRSAVKTKDNPTGIETLLKNIFEQKLLTCPHGRPIMIEITFKTLDKYFERI